MFAFSLSDRGFMITIAWIPAHSAIAGNEHAERLAKAGSNSIEILSQPIYPQEVLMVPRHYCIEKWQQYWSEDALGRHRHSILPNVNIHPWFRGLKGGRSFIRAMSRLISNHYGLNAHLIMTLTTYCARVKRTKIVGINSFISENSKKDTTHLSSRPISYVRYRLS